MIKITSQVKMKIIDLDIFVLINDSVDIERIFTSHTFMYRNRPYYRVWDKLPDCSMDVVWLDHHLNETYRYVSKQKKWTFFELVCDTDTPDIELKFKEALCN